MIDKKINTKGFTIVEVLTAVAIVAIMVAILVPAVSQVRRLARNVRQKAQMTAMTIGIEVFKNDFGVYPDSSIENYSTGNAYNGANKLAEALVGLDYLGVHTRTIFHSDGVGDNNADGTVSANEYLYGRDSELDLSDDTAAGVLDSKNSRMGPYLEPEKANAAYLSDISSQTSSSNFGKSLVLLDSYAKKNATFTTEKYGMPILYFKANTSKIEQEPTNDVDRIYCWEDNRDLIEKKPFWDYTATPVDYLGETTTFDDNKDLFADLVINPKLKVGNREMPYNSRSYILVSAGEDGFYGTQDDVFNFDKK